MHELSIALSLIDRILEESERRGGIVVEIVHVKIGALAGIDKDALTFAYEVACQDTPLLGSRLAIESAPLMIYCTTCAEQRAPISEWQLCCSFCQTPAPDIVQGKELELIALELAA